MSRPDDVIATLRKRNELWTPAPGLIALRGEVLSRFRVLEKRVRAVCMREDVEEWLVAPALPLDVLQRAGYFASFPQWLTVASHLADDEPTLERLAASQEPARELTTALAAPSAALPPAVCYHVYAALAGRRLDAPIHVTAQGCCWRHEGPRFAPLERCWAFTMRELVCIGTEEDCLRFAGESAEIVRALAEELEVPFTIEVAEDPFFAPTSRGRALLQRVKALKHELRLAVDSDRTIAAASINVHERFFGDAFDIRASDGQPAFTACLAFGLERWLLAALVHDVSSLAPNRAEPLVFELAP